jgi:sulfite exporter TauE/SafE
MNAAYVAIGAAFIAIGAANIATAKKVEDPSRTGARRMAGNLFILAGVIFIATGFLFGGDAA